MKGIKMETTNRNFTNPDDSFDGPTDEELKQIEEEISAHLGSVPPVEWPGIYTANPQLLTAAVLKHTR